ncbi:class I SAM-dependent methyltransferase [Breznakiellaceae bacterium SP9]
MSSPVAQAQEKCYPPAMSAYEWFADESFWQHYAPIMFDSSHWAEVPLVADGVTALSALDLYKSAPTVCSNPPRILDLCCGMGRISLELSRRGFAVTGVDLSESLLQTAREDAAYEGLELEFVQSDARGFKRPDFFDAAVNLYISFGYFDDEADDLRVAKNVYTSLKPGAAFIIETLGKEIAVRDFTAGEWFERAGYTVLTEYKAIDAWTRLANRWILLKDNEHIERSFTQRLYAASELRCLLQKAGFETVALYGDWDECAYDENARTLIACARKGR